MDVENVFVCVYVTYVSTSIYCTNKIYHLYLLQFITIYYNFNKHYCVQFSPKIFNDKKKNNKMSDLVVFYVIIKQIQNLILFIILLCVNLVNNINIGK